MWYNSTNEHARHDVQPSAGSRQMELVHMNDSTILRCCSKCGIEKPLNKDHFHYYNQRGKKWVYRIVCKECVNAPKRQKPPKPVAPDGMKYCSRCEKFYPETLEHFRPHKDYTNGLFSWCRQCCRDWDNEWNKNNPDRVKAWKTKYRATPEYQETRLAYEDSESYRVSQQRYRAKPESKAKSKLRINRRRKRVQGLPDTMTPEQWLNALAHFDNRCAACLRPVGLWHTLAMDHWIPVSNPDCPGTVVNNCVPLCHGADGCNNSKGSRDPVEWLEWKFGKRKAKMILKRITEYLEQASAVARKVA